MKNKKADKELLEGVAIGIKKDFERFNKRKAKKGEAPVSFFSFADKYVDYRNSLTKKGIIIGVVIGLVLAFFILGVPESVVEVVADIIIITLSMFFSYRFQKNTEKMFSDAAKEVITVCKDKNIDIYKYIENEYWKN